MEGATPAPVGLPCAASLAVNHVPAATHAPVRSGRPIPRVLCQVPGCGVDLSASRLFHQRYHVCPTHCTAESVVMAGIVQRFCQQCGQFHDIERFAPGMRSCRAQLARHAERRRLRRAQAKAAAENKRGNEPAYAQAGAAAAPASAPAVMDGASALASALATAATAPPAGGPVVTSEAAMAALLGGEGANGQARKRSRSPQVALAPNATGGALPPPSKELKLELAHLAPDGTAHRAAGLQQAGSTSASEQSARSTQPPQQQPQLQAPALPPNFDVLMVAAAAGAQAQAAMAGRTALPVASSAPAPWALPPPAQWQQPPAWPGAWPWQQQWPGTAPFWGAPPAGAPAALPPPPAPAATAPADLLQLLLRQAAAPTASPTAPAEHTDALVSAFRAAGEQYLRQQQSDMQVAALLSRMATQSSDQNATQLQQLLGALVQPLL